MANANEASIGKRIKVGLFTLGGLAFLGILSVYVNNRPFWWRSCEPVTVTVEDATGLKNKSPVKSLGLEIGYISEIGLITEGVKLKLCITAPVAMTPETKAYVRSEGFLGDRFLELKPVKYTGTRGIGHSLNFLIPSAYAEDTTKPTRDIPVAEKQADMQAVMTQLHGLVTDLKSAINPDEIRQTVRQLNKTLEDASKALSPQGGLTATAQRSLIKLEDAIEQLRDQVTRINQGQGSVGMVLNDPTYADELKKALMSMNKLLNRMSEIRLEVTLGINQLTGYSATRADFNLRIFPKPDRFYLLGVASDPRGSVSQETTTTYVNGGNATTIQNNKTSKGGYAFTAMIGKVLSPRVNLSVGLHYGDGDAALGINLGPAEALERIQFINELYFRPKTDNGAWSAVADGRSYLLYQPYSILYLTGGLEGYRKIDGRSWG